MNVWMAADMKYSFVEMRTHELATAAIALDKVELCGRALNVGRPSGYVAPTGPAILTNPLAGSLAAMQAMASGPMGQMMMAASGGGPPSKAVCLENMMTPEVRDCTMHANVNSCLAIAGSGWRRLQRNCGGHLG